MKIYGKELGRWTSEEYRNNRYFTKVVQRELAYTEYREDGSLKQTGSEDFTPERLKQDTEEKWIWIWDGQKRNAGGHKWWECIGCYRISKGGRKVMEKIIKAKYNDAYMVQFR